MKNICFIIFFASLFTIANAQDCTKEMAAAQPSIFEKATGENSIRMKDPALMKTGEEINTMILSALKVANGLHGFTDVKNDARNSCGGLTSFQAYLYAYKIHCQKGPEKFSWKGMWNFEIMCEANSILNIAETVHNDDIGTGRNKDICVNNSIVYVTKYKQNQTLLNGYPYYDSNSYCDGVLVTKPGVPFFLPVTRREYLVLLRKNTEATLLKLKKDFAGFQKEKTPAQPGSEIYKSNKEIEDQYNTSIDGITKGLQEIDRFSSSQNEVWMTKPCITGHLLELPLYNSFDKEKEYFQETDDAGKAWMIINPDYINKNIPPTAPQFFYVRWVKSKSNFDKERSIAEAKAAELFKANFNFGKLASLLK